MALRGGVFVRQANWLHMDDGRLFTALYDVQYPRKNRLDPYPA